MIAAIFFVILAVGSIPGWGRIEYVPHTSGRFDWRQSLEIGTSLRLVNDEASFVDVVSSCSSTDMYHCPLAGFVLIGSQGGDLLMLSRDGFVALQVDGPTGAGALQVVRVVQAARTQYDVLLVASFGGISGLRGLLVNHRTMEVHPSGWLVLNDALNDIVDVRVVTSLVSANGSLMVLPSVVVLDVHGDAYVAQDVGLHATSEGVRVLRGVDAGDVSFRWPFHHVQHETSHIFASYKFGVFLVGQDPEISLDGRLRHVLSRVDRQSLKPLPVSSWYPGTISDRVAFDDMFHELYMSRVNENMIWRHNLMPGRWADVQSTRLLDRLGHPTHIASSGGYSMVFGSDLVVLYNHSMDLVQDNTALWDTERFISMIASQEDLMGENAGRVLDRLLDRLSNWFRHWNRTKPGFQGFFAVWGPLAYLYRNNLVFISSSRRAVQLYRPVFRAVVGKSSPSRSKNDVATLLLGILKSVGLIVAGVIGLLLSKKSASGPLFNGQHSHRNSGTPVDEARDNRLNDALDTQIANIYTEYKIERDEMRACRRRKLPDSGPHLAARLRQEKVDFAPDPEMWLG